MKTKSYNKYKDPQWQNFKEKLDYMKETVDSVYLLTDLGFNVDRQTTKEIRCECPIHGGDNKTAFRFNKVTKTWVCFTHKCHEIHGNDVIGLISAMTGRTFVEAVNYLKGLTGDLRSVDFIEAKRKREMDAFINSYDQVTAKPDSVNEASLLKFRWARSNYFNTQGFRDSTLDYFEIGGGWRDKHKFIRDVIPIRNAAGDLIAYSLRDIRPNADDDFKYISTPGFDKQSCLYNLDKAHGYGYELPLIVVEGFKSVWRLYDYGVKNVVAVMGSEIVQGQQALLFQHAFKGIVTFFDNDAAGVKGTNNAYANLHDKMDVRPVFIQEVDENGKGLDPADLTKEQVHEYLSTYF
jgi:DNA primase